MSTLSLRKIKHDSSAVDNIQLNSNGNTSVGTTNVAGVPLEVGGSVALGRLSNTEYSRFLGIGGSGGTFINGTTGGGYIEFTNDTSYNNEIHLVTHWSGNQHARVLSADYKGRVTKPYQPAFHACNGPNQTGGNTTVAFTTIKNNVGNCYSGSTYRFTAPIAGTYFFSTTFMNNSGTYSRFGLYKNGAVYDANLFTEGTTYARSTACWIIPLAANDYVYVVNGINTDPSCDIHADYRNFCGYLLG